MSSVQKRKISETDKVIAKKDDDVLPADLREMLHSVIPPKNREIMLKLRSGKKSFNDLLEGFEGSKQTLKNHIEQLLWGGIISQILSWGKITEQEKVIIHMLYGSEPRQKSYSDIVHFLRMEDREQELKNSLEELIKLEAIKKSYTKDKIEMYKINPRDPLLIEGGNFKWYIITNIGKNILKVADTFPDFWKVLSSVKDPIDWAILNELQSGEKSSDYMINDLKMEGREQELNNHLKKLRKKEIINLNKNNNLYALTDKGEKFIKSLDDIFPFPPVPEDPKEYQEYLRNNNTDRDI